MNTGLFQKVSNDFNIMDGTNIPRMIKETAKEDQMVQDSIEKYKKEQEELLLNSNDGHSIPTWEEVEKYMNEQYRPLTIDDKKISIDEERY